jgi:molybdopterin converting factor small subunit
MQIHVRLGAGLSDASGVARLVVELPATATGDELVEHLAAHRPELAASLNQAILVVGGRYIHREDVLTADQEVALLLPAAGGEWRSRR